MAVVTLMEEVDLMRRTNLGLRVEVGLGVEVPHRGVVLKQDGRGVVGVEREVEAMRMGGDRHGYSITLRWW